MQRAFPRSNKSKLLGKGTFSSGERRVNVSFALTFDANEMKCLSFIHLISFNSSMPNCTAGHWDGQFVKNWKLRFIALGMRMELKVRRVYFFFLILNWSTKNPIGPRAFFFLSTRFTPMTFALSTKTIEPLANQVDIKLNELKFTQQKTPQLRDNYIR